MLLLDEPTNDLDVNTLRALEEALENFAGCAVVISHDRWFLDRIATHILAFEGDSKTVWFDGNYSEYEADRRMRLRSCARRRALQRYRNAGPQPRDSPSPATRRSSPPGRAPARDSHCRLAFSPPWRPCRLLQYLIEPEENEQVVAAVLAAKPNARRVSLDARIDQLLKATILTDKGAEASAHLSNFGRFPSPASRHISH